METKSSEYIYDAPADNAQANTDHTLKYNEKIKETTHT